MKKVYLDPVDGRKSFYCKASMEMMEDGTRVLISYTTAVAKIVRGRYLFRLCGQDKKFSSPTTMRHLVAFCVHNGLEPITKKAWNAMPTMNW